MFLFAQKRVGDLAKMRAKDHLLLILYGNHWCRGDERKGREPTPEVETGWRGEGGNDGSV